MKKILSIAILMASIVSLKCFPANIIVKVPENSGIESFACYYASIDQLANARSKEERSNSIHCDTINIKNNTGIVELPDSETGYQVGLEFLDNTEMVPLLFVGKGDKVHVEITNISPMEYTMSGSELAEGLTELMILQKTANERREHSPSSGESTEMNLESELVKVQKEYIQNNQEKERSLLPLIIGGLSYDDFMEEYMNVSSVMEKSILFPILKNKYKGIIEFRKTEERQRKLASGGVPAPDFTLKDIEGKEVSLSDFRGKWVILDFWGSWCGWCLIGFPEMKEAYRQYSEKLEIIGIDCNESEEDWRNWLNDNELPWVNLYNPKESDLQKEYELDGFPTKVVIDPEGIIRNYTVGEGPSFYKELEELLNN